MDKARLLAEIIENSGPKLRKPEDFTWKEFAEEWERLKGEKITEYRSHRILDKWVDEGRFKSEVRYDPNTSRYMNVWWPIDK